MRYQVRMFTAGRKKYFYIVDNETLDLVPLPSKYLKFKAESGRSPSTVQHAAFAICYYLNYLLEKGLELGKVPELPFEEQNLHFVEFLYWTKEGHHRTAKRKEITGNGTCNAYLKDVFRFFLYLADGGYAPPLRVLVLQPDHRSQCPRCQENAPLQILQGLYEGKGTGCAGG